MDSAGLEDLDLHVLHTCDNPPCVNPAHLYAGTQQRNIDDMWERDRGPSGLKNGHYTQPECTLKGEQHGMARLTPEQVLEIRALYLPGIISQSKLAKRYGVTREHVREILHRRRWRHLDG